MSFTRSLTNITPSSASSLCCNLNGSLVGAVESTGSIYISRNYGLSFTNTFNTSISWTSICCNAEGNQMFACGVNIYKSVNYGSTWTNLNISGGHICSNALGDKIVVSKGGYSGNETISVSSDYGQNWTVRYTNSTENIIKIVSNANGDKFYAIISNPVSSFGKILSSLDSGVTWTQRESARYWSSISCNAAGDLVVACEGIENVSTGSIYVSYDSGNTWTQSSNTGLAVFTAVSCSSSGNNMIATYKPNLSSGDLVNSINRGYTW